MFSKLTTCPWKAPQTWIGRIGAGFASFVLVGIVGTKLAERSAGAHATTSSKESELLVAYKHIPEMILPRRTINFMLTKQDKSLDSVLMNYGITDSTKFLEWTSVNMYDKKNLYYSIGLTAGCLGSAALWFPDIKKAKTLCGAGFATFLTAWSLGVSATMIYQAATDPKFKKSWKFRNDWIGAYLDSKK